MDKIEQGKLSYLTVSQAHTNEYTSAAANVTEPSQLPIWLLLVLVTLSGFAVAGFLSAARQALTGNSSVEFKFNSPVQAIGTIFTCMFSAPYWIGTFSLGYFARGQLPAAIFGFLIVLAVMWSFCSGVIIVQLLYLVGLV